MISLEISHVVLLLFYNFQEKFKSGLLYSAEDFKKTISNLSDEFEANGPFTDAVSVGEALDYISSLRERLRQLKLQEANLQRGLNIFKIDQPQSHVIMAIEKVYMNYIYILKCSERISRYNWSCHHETVGI